jgi:hypothetical protein
MHVTEDVRQWDQTGAIFRPLRSVYTNSDFDSVGCNSRIQHCTKIVIPIFDCDFDTNLGLFQSPIVILTVVLDATAASKIGIILILCSVGCGCRI